MSERTDPLAAQSPELEALYEAVWGFLGTTSIFRQEKASRDAFEKMALAAITAKMAKAGAEMGAES